ncbi:MAG: hypothetical protein HPY44_22100 [Armatimonadetes bacterium]|nr:hypothetical protein [Armatimonadota bacterium]
MRICIVLPMLLLASTACLADEFVDKFAKYGDGADGSPNWDVPGVIWEVRNEAMQFDGPPSTVFLKDRPRYGTITVEAVLTISKATSDGWKIAGVSVWDSNDRYWHLALVESPDTDGAKHFCELAQMYQGEWPSQAGVRRTANEGGQLQWEYGKPYRLTISLTPDGIEGRVLDEAQAEVAHIAYEFTGAEPTIGRPALRASGFRGFFDDFRFTGTDPVPDAAPEEVTYPPYDVAASDVFTSEATGFFRTENRDGRWWLVDPKGRAFWAIGTDHCRYSGHWCQKLGYAPYGRNNDAKYESREQWAELATDRLKSWGFNLLGAGNGNECRYRGLAHTDFVAFGSNFSSYDDIVPKTTWTGFPNVFSPKWPRYCDRTAQQAVRQSRTDPWLFGYFLDNELEWYGKSHREEGMFDEAMKKPADHTAKIALVDYLRGLHKTIEDFNAAWGTNLESFEDILARQELSGTNLQRVRDDKVGFVRLVAELYFKYTTEAIRKHDPNHLILGCRFAGNAPAGIWDICGKYCDIVTFNYYGRVDLDKGIAPGHVEIFTDYYEQANKPLMITEWSFPALDSGLPCKHGAGMRVDTQAQKAECFRIYQEMFLRLPFMVGSDYFMWVDEPALGISDTFPEDSNYGLVNERDEVYEELTRMATRIHATAYSLHNGEYPEIGMDGVGTAFNRGKVDATVEARIIRDGVLERRELKLAAGREIALDLPAPTAPGAHLTVVELDPDRKTPDADRENNRAVKLDWVPGLKAPEGFKADSCVALLVANQSAEALEPAVAIAKNLWSRFLGYSTPFDLRLQAITPGGEPVPVQVCGTDLVFLLERLEPWGCATLLVGYGPDKKPLSPGVTVDGAGNISNGRLTLTGPAGSSGNLLDRIMIDGQMLGTYNPLVWQEVSSQNLWVRTDSAKLDVEVGEVGAVIHGTATGGSGRPITAVDDQGRQEAQRSVAAPFRVSHDIILPAKTNWFLARLDSIKCLDSVDQRSFMLKGYFFYLNGLIGGSAEGDVPASETHHVPNYYALQGGAWQDDEAGLVFGTVPLSERITSQFWLSPDGGQHPDARRGLDFPVTLQPGTEWRDSDQPWLLIYGAQSADKPWLAMNKLGEALEGLVVEVKDL